MGNTRAVAGVLSGFAIIAAVIAVGYAAGRFGVITPETAPQLARLIFFVLAPCLLFTILATASTDQLLCPLLAVPLGAAVAAYATYAVVARGLWRRSVAQTTMGALAAGYVNSNNIGLPVAVYVLGSAAYVAPLLMAQLVIVTPIALTVLDAATRGRVSVGQVLLGPVRNPLVVASLLGAVVGATGAPVPDVVLEPLSMIGAATVPLLLMNYGASLHGIRILQAGPERKDVVLATAIKAVAMPAVAWALGAWVFGLSGHDLFVVVALAALPSAHNTFTYAQRYGAGELVVRDTILLSTVAAVPVLLGAAALLK